MTPTLPLGLLATAVSASLALAQGGEDQTKFQDPSPVSFRAGSGITFDGGDDFRLNLKNRLQIQFSHTYGDGFEADNNTTNFDIRRARTTLSGHAFRKNLLYRLDLEWTDGDSLAGEELENDSVLKDAWVQWDSARDESSKVGLRIGQSKTHFGLEGTGTFAGLYFVERADATNYFSNARSRGAWLHGTHGENPFRWTAGVQNNGVANGLGDASEEGDNPDNGLVYVISANFDPLGDFVGGRASYEDYLQGDLEGTSELKGTLGAGMAIDERGVETTVNGTDTTRTSNAFNLNTAWKVDSFWAQAEYFSRTDEAEGFDEDADAEGFTVAVGYAIPKPGDTNLQWGLGIRWSSRRPDDELATVPPSTLFDKVEEMTLGINAFHHGHACKTQLNFVSTNDKTLDQDEQAVVIQFQITI